jgi:hypothetical protein
MVERLFQVKKKIGECESFAPLESEDFEATTAEAMAEEDS